MLSVGCISEPRRCPLLIHSRLSLRIITDLLKASPHTRIFMCVCYQGVTSDSLYNQIFSAATSTCKLCKFKEEGKQCPPFWSFLAFMLRLLVQCLYFQARIFYKVFKQPSEYLSITLFLIPMALGMAMLVVRSVDSPLCSKLKYLNWWMDAMNLKTFMVLRG